MFERIFILIVCLCVFNEAPALSDPTTPVLLVRGIDCSDRLLRPLENAIRKGGVDVVDVASFTPANGQVGIDEIAKQIAQAAQKLKDTTRSEKIDVVGFSMGALASRYFIQRLSGKDFVRKFISISGPHNGTYAAYLRFFQKGVSDMLPGSDLINDLNKDIDPWGEVEVYSYYTPYDIIVVPAETAILKNSKEVKSFHVSLHHQMIKDPHVLSEISKTLAKHISPHNLNDTLVASSEKTSHAIETKI